MPRFAFEKFPDADPTLTTQMKSVGETMAIGRTFKESLQKALRGLEVGRFGIGCDRRDRWGTSNQPTCEEIIGKLATPNAERIWYIRYAFKAGHVGRGSASAHQDRPVVPASDPRPRRKWRTTLQKCPSLEAADFDLMLEAKQHGFIDRQLANIWNTSEGGGPDEAQIPRHRCGLQARRHLRRRVRGVHAVLLLDL